MEPCFGLIFFFAGTVWGIFRIARGILGSDLQPDLDAPTSGAPVLAEVREPVLDAVPADQEPAHKDPAVRRHRPWIVREWVDGQVVPTPEGGHPQVAWTREGRRLRWFEKQRGFQTWTVVMARATLRVSPGFQVRPRAGVIPLPGPGRPCSQATGLEEFDRRWQILLSPHAVDVLPLSRPVWETMLALSHVGVADAVLDVHPTRAWVSLPGSIFDGPGIPTTSAHAREVVEHACHVLDAVLAECAAYAPVPAIRVIRSAGVEGSPAAPGAIRVLESDLAAGGQSAFCPVCAEPVGEQPVHCLRCATPHHGECWEYVGACSVFGCRSTEKRG